MRVLSVVAKCGPWIVMVVFVLMRPLTLVVVGSGLRSLMLGVISLACAGGGILLFRCCIGSSLTSRAFVNCDGSSSLTPHPLVLSAGGLPKGRRIADIVRNVALLPGPLHLWDSGWVGVPPVAISAEDVCLWPYSVDIFLIKFVTFLGSLHWPSAGNDLGPGGVSYVELLILCELWAGERLQFEKAVPRCRRVDRPISVSAVPFGPGIDTWLSCKLLGAMLRALCVLPGGFGRFLPCAICANYSRLRHIGWVKSGHGLTSRPRETSDVRFLDELLFSLVTLLGLGVPCCVGLCL